MPGNPSWKEPQGLISLRVVPKPRENALRKGQLPFHPPQERAAPSSSPHPWNSRSLDTNPRGQQHFQPGFWGFHSWGSPRKGGQGRIWDLGTRECRCGMGLSLSRAKTRAQIQGFLSSPDKFPVLSHMKAMKRHSDVTVREKKEFFPACGAGEGSGFALRAHPRRPGPSRGCWGQDTKEFSFNFLSNAYFVLLGGDFWGFGVQEIHLLRPNVLDNKMLGAAPGHGNGSTRKCRKEPFFGLSWSLFFQGAIPERNSEVLKARWGQANNFQT